MLLHAATRLVASGLHSTCVQIKPPAKHPLPVSPCVSSAHVSPLPVTCIQSAGHAAQFAAVTHSHTLQSATLTQSPCPPACPVPLHPPRSQASRSGRIAAQAKLDELMQGQPPLPPALRGAIADAGTASPALLDHLLS
jgi:hypothetical protein